jgi:hypothetical protein
MEAAVYLVFQNESIFGPFAASIVAGCQCTKLMRFTSGRQFSEHSRNDTIVPAFLSGTVVAQQKFDADQICS